MPSDSYVAGLIVAVYAPVGGGDSILRVEKRRSNGTWQVITGDELYDEYLDGIIMDDGTQDIQGGLIVTVGAYDFICRFPQGTFGRRGIDRDFIQGFLYYIRNIDRSVSYIRGGPGRGPTRSEEHAYRQNI